MKEYYMHNYKKLVVIALLIFLLSGCGNSYYDSNQMAKTGIIEQLFKNKVLGNISIDSLVEFIEMGVSTEEIYVQIPGLKNEYTFLWLSDLHIITENDEIALEDLETVTQRRESFKNAVGMYSDDFWLKLTKPLDDYGADALLFGGDMIDHAANSNIACLKEGLDKLDTPYLYVRADHDYSPYYCAAKDEAAVAGLHAEIDGYEEISLIEFEDLCLVGINNSTKQISAAALQKMKDICAKKKPIILITHVPLDSLYDTSLKEESKAVWNDRALIWGNNCAYIPDNTTQEFIDLVYAEDSPIKAVLAGHLHFSWGGQLTANAREHVFAPAYHGNIGIVKVVQAEAEIPALNEKLSVGNSAEETASEYDIYLNDDEDTVADLAFAGDICLTEDGYVMDHYDALGGDINLCLSEEIIDRLNEADISMINHEYPVSTRGEALEGKYYTFRASPEREIILKQLGIDIVSLANNHIYDFGADAFYDTLDALKQAEIPYVGAGTDIEEASRPVYFETGGIKIGFVSANRSEKFIFTPEAGENSPGVVRMYDTTMMNNIIKEASEQCDYLIAYVHWGTEDSKYYEEYQTAIAQEFFDSGADAIIGSHPHVLQGIGYVDGKPIVYSLGDFWFNGETKYTSIVNLKVSMDGLVELSVLPCIQEGYETHYLNDESGQKAFYDYLRELSPEAEIDGNGIVTDKKT